MSHSLFTRKLVVKLLELVEFRFGEEEMNVPEMRLLMRNPLDIQRKFISFALFEEPQQDNRQN
jgi:hypothetical protein